MEVNMFLFPLNKFHKIIKSYTPRYLLSIIYRRIEKIASLKSLYVGLNSSLEPCWESCPRWYISSDTLFLFSVLLKADFCIAEAFSYYSSKNSSHFFEVKTVRPACSYQELLRLWLCHVGGLCFIFDFCCFVFDILLRESWRARSHLKFQYKIVV